MPADNHQYQDGVASDEEKSGSPKPCNFFDSRLKKTRFEVAWKWAATTLVLMAFILSVMSIYWGSLFHAEENLSSLIVAVVDFDGLTAPYNTSGISPVFGPYILDLAREQIASGMPTLGFEPLFASDFQYDPANVRKAVYEQHYWAAIIINANATYEATMAVDTGDASYDPTGAAQLIYVQARDDSSFDNFVLPPLMNFLFDAVAGASEQWGSTVFARAATNTTLAANLAKAPAAVSPGIGFSQFDLRPFYPYQATPAESVGLIYLIILSFFSFSFYLPVYTKLLNPEGHPPLKFWQLIIVRYIGIQGAYLFLSLAYSLVSLAFQIDFSTPNPVQSTTEVIVTVGGYTNAPKFGAATFPCYWVLNWIGMMALGLACENVAMIIGQPWTGLWLIFWVITNVSTSFYAIEIEPHFFYWGYAWPLHNVVEATRTLLFDTHSRLGLNFGILIAWVAVNTALFPLCCMFMGWKKKKNINEYWA